MNGDTTTFWKFLENHASIQIPIIQRDYAQGRRGKEALRKAFLRDLKSALDSDKRLKLDFVYGVAENGVLTPLDGQQRLTTLWLLHWYIAYKAGKIGDAKGFLEKFSYETRQSSREFCKRLSAFDIPQPNGNGIVVHIQNQTWFRSSWNHDPTIQSMFRMLGGSKYGALDGIEGVFNACHDGECIECRLEQCPVSQVKCDSYDKYWNRLTSNKCPIVFHYLDIQGIGQTDNLYIKMNARGKPLTSFENFKADLAGYISRKATKEAYTEGNYWQGLNHSEEGFAIKMDTDWMNGIFWKYKSSDSVVDEICFAFINRYFFNAHAIAMNKISDLKIGDDEVFDFLYGRNGKDKEVSDDQIAYFGFDSAYAQVLKNEQKLLSRLADTLNSFQSFYKSQDESIFQPPWGDDFRFVPAYDSNELHYDFAGNQIRKIVKITQPHRVVFHAVCKFFEKFIEQRWRDGDIIDALKNWMRVVWNIVENAEINTVSGMVGCLKLINEFSLHSHDILIWLSGPDFKINSRFAYDQVYEEKMKAQKLRQDTQWEALILRAEKMVWLKGRIGVLVHDWKDASLEQFKGRLELIEAMFKTAETEQFYLQRMLLSRYDAELPKQEIDLSDNDVNKKNLLTKVLPDCFKRIDENRIAHNDSAWISDLTQTKLLENSRGKLVDGYCGKVVVLWGTSGCRWTAFGSKVGGNVILGKHRDLLKSTPGILLENQDIVPETNFVCGKDVNFQYGEHWFRWLGVPDYDNGEHDIYLLKGKWKDESSYATHDNGQSKNGGEQNYYCFNVDGMKDEVFTTELDKLIASYTSDRNS